MAEDAPRLQRFCGTVAEGTQVRSSGNTMAIVFYTDASISNGGFMASYSSEEPAGKSVMLEVAGALQLRFMVDAGVVQRQ